MKDYYGEEVPRDKQIVYERILEVLAVYWIEEPEEDYVEIKMEFRKGNEYQSKLIRWKRRD